MEQKYQFVSQFPLFSCLTDDQRTILAQMLEIRVRPRYSFVYLPGDPSDCVFFLAKGAIKLGTHNEDGKEIIKHLVHPKAMFGELGVVGERERQEFAQALKEDVLLYSLSNADLQQLMRDNYELSSQIMQLFGQRLMSAEHRLESLMFKDARTRIVDFLRNSIEQRGRRVGFEMLLKHSLTHQDIANITCTSRQTVTLVLNELKKSELIHFNRGRILVRDMAKLA